MELLHTTARTIAEWMIYSLLEGTILAMFVWILLRLVPRQNAGTRFALWFSVLLTTVLLPFGGVPVKSVTALQSGAAESRALIAIPISIASAAFLIWATIAALALMRVLAALWQVSRLRRISQEIDLNSLMPEPRKVIEEFGWKVSLRFSDRVQVPVAIGFLKPAIVLPHWFLQEISAAELKHVLVHELTHLRRHDDWTNLAQKTIKAILFFHPVVWWVERRLSLEREMACDDAVLAQSASPRDYALCLSHIAEKSFVRKQMALVQAVVTRMRQLSQRVAQILDVNRPGSTRLWKPAIPLVVLAASLCGFSVWSAPTIVVFNDDAARPLARTAVISDAPSSVATDREMKIDNTAIAQPRLVPASASLAISKPKPIPRALKAKRASAPRLLQAKALRWQPLEAVSSAEGDYVVQSEQFTVIMTRQGGPSAGGQETWQVHMWQVRILAPANNNSQKAIPRKST